MSASSHFRFRTPNTPLPIVERRCHADLIAAGSILAHSIPNRWQFSPIDRAVAKSCSYR